MPEYKWPSGVTDERRDDIASIIWIIHENSPIRSEDGRATGQLMNLLREGGVELSGGWLSKTLGEIDRKGSPFGQFITRDVVGKRTYEIASTRDPAKHPFPADPRKGRQAVTIADVVAPGVAADETEPANTESDQDEEVEIVDTPEAEVDDIIEDFEEIRVQPGVAIEALAPPSLPDKILYIVSLLNEILTDQLTAPQRNFDEQINRSLTAVNLVLEENQELKKQNEALRSDKRMLASALEQANAIMRERLGANGHQKEMVST